MINVSGPIQCLHGKIAVKPFRRDASVSVDPKSGMAVHDQRSQLTQVEVVFGSDKIPGGSTVWLRGQAHADDDAKKIFQAAGTEFVYISEAHVMMFQVPVSLQAPVSTSGTVQAPIGPIWPHGAPFHVEQWPSYPYPWHGVVPPPNLNVPSPYVTITTTNTDPEGKK